MTASTTTASQHTILTQLARVHARRYARHPLFLIGFLIAIGYTIWDVVDDPGFDPNRDGGIHFYSAFLIGVLGLIVAYRLTRTEERALALLPSAPTSQTTRTLALGLSCLVPAIAGGVILVIAVAGWQIGEPTYLERWADVVGPAELVAWAITTNVVACLGAPLLGVAVARWWRFPGAGVVAAILLVAISVVGNTLAQEAMPDPFPLITFVWLLSPWAIWLETQASTGLTGEALGSGSPIGHLVYTIGLCGLAIWAAVIKDAEGPERTVWRRNGIIALVVAVGGLVWAVLG
jgi:hypothetical protein